MFRSLQLCFFHLFFPIVLFSLSLFSLIYDSLWAVSHVPLFLSVFPFFLTLFNAFTPPDNTLLRMFDVAFTIRKGTAALFCLCASFVCCSQG
jgi:uncharacterized membrane protein YbhN (UPF0104 family)